MKPFKSKKAEAFRILNYTFWRLLFISIIFLFLYLFVASKINAKIELDDLRANIFSMRVLTSSNGVAYSSEYNSRIYPGIISLKDFKDDTLSGSFFNDSDRFSANIILQNTGNNAGNNTQRDIYLNKKWFERYYT